MIYWARGTTLIIQVVQPGVYRYNVLKRCGTAAHNPPAIGIQAAAAAGHAHDICSSNARRRDIRDVIWSIWGVWEFKSEFEIKIVKFFKYLNNM